MKLEEEGVDTDGEIEEDPIDDHQGGDGHGPGKSRGYGEVVTVDGWAEDGKDPEGFKDGGPQGEDVDKVGVPLENPNHPNDGEDEREQAEGNIHTSKHLHPLLPILGSLLPDVVAEVDPVHLLLGAIHKHQLPNLGPKVGDISSQTDEVGGDTDVDDVDDGDDQRNDEGPPLQGDAAEKLLGVVGSGVVRHLDNFNLQPSSTTVG